jgi:protein-S-isoprenylcysteine O-methyltransferase Ste14
VGATSAFDAAAGDCAGFFDSYRRRIRDFTAAMTICGWLIFALWLTFIVYWSFAAGSVTRSIGSRWIWWREIALRLGFFALVVLAVRVAVFRGALPGAQLYAFNTGMLLGLTGLVLCAAGMGLALLGRACLGRNWAMPLANKENPELVTTGPYALVRHPIYSGMLLAVLGSAIGQSVLWLLPLIAYGPHFIRSARREERFLIEQFPERYRAYMQRTRMLLPFVL